LGTPGKLIDPSMYYTLQAKDSFGRAWLCDRVLPDFSTFFGDNSWDTIVSGQLYLLESTQEQHYSVKTTYIRLAFFVDVKLPANTVTEVIKRVGGEEQRGASALDVAKVETEFGSFVFRTEPGKLIVSCSCLKAPQEHFFVRIMESLSFVFGKRLWWNFVEERRDRTVIRRIRGGNESDERSLVLPVNENDTPSPFFTWRLFSLYLSFISSHKGGTLHPCSRVLFPVYQAHQGTVESQALALGVAVEGICKELFPETVSQAQELRVWAKSLREHCEVWKGFQDPLVRTALYDRISGLLGQLNSVRAKDTLMRLVSDGVAYERHVKAWGKLRNQAAHANIHASGTLQELVDLCAGVTMLLYHLIFKAIGYEGAYTDHSEYGYPRRWFRGRRPTAEEIAVAAYFLYLKEPDRYGNDLHHWFTARAMLENGRY
jgi:hypothetical protein